MNEHKRQLESGFVLVLALLLVVCSLGVIAVPARAAITPAWTAAPDMGDARTQAVVVNDENGLVYVMGGVQGISGGNYNASIPDAASYNPATGAWTVLAPMWTGVRGAAGAYGQDGRVYVIGGINTSSALSLTQIYDPETNEWTNGSDIPTAVWEAKAVALGEDTIIVAGGEGAAGAVQRYDISDDSWISGSDMPDAVHAGVFLPLSSNYALYVGGVDDLYLPVSSVFFYYFGGTWDYWDYEADLPETLAALAGTSPLDGCVYVFGGGLSDSNIEQGAAAAYRYNYGSNTWTKLPDLNTATRYLGAACTPSGKILAIGGNNDTTVMSKVESMTVMSLSVTLSSTTIAAGQSILVTVKWESAFTTADYYSAELYLLSEDNVTYGWTEIDGPGPGIAFEVPVSSMVPAGDYKLVVDYLYADFADYSESEDYSHQYDITVTDSYSADEQIAMLAANITMLQMAMIQMNASNQAYLQAQLTMLQGILAQIGSGLTTMGAGQVAAMAQLNQTLASLQTQLDNFQTQIDRVEGKADNSGTLGIASLALVGVALAMLALTFMAVRRNGGKSPPIG